MSESIVTVGGIRHRVRIDGSGGDWVVLSNSLGCTLEMWDPQVRALARTHRVLRYDTRGHGGSEAPPGPYRLDGLAADLLGILDATGVADCTLAGLSMGGMVAQHAALREPGRFRGIVLADTTSRYGPDVAGFWAQRARTARTAGLAPIAESVPERWFTAAWVREHPGIVARHQNMVLGTDPEGYASCCEAIAAIDVTGRLATLPMPVLVLVGDQDPSTTVDHARRIHEAVPGSTLRVISDAAHLSNVEQPEAFTAHLMTFLQGIPS